MLVFLIICIWVLTLIAVPIRVGVDGFADFFTNNGYIKLYLFGIKIFSAKLHLELDSDKRNNLVVEHGKKQDKIHINNDPKDKKSIMRMIKNPAFKIVLVEKIIAHFVVGKNNDAFFTTLLLGAVRVVFCGAVAYLKSQQKVDVTESFTPQYNNDVLQVDFTGIIHVSIADIICSIAGNTIRKSRVKNKLKSQEVLRT